MPSQLYPRPSDPYVKRNPFITQEPNPAGILPYGVIKNRLPQPILPDHPEWLELYWRAWEIAWGNLHRPRPESGFPSSYIDAAFNDNIFMWDTAFMTQFGRYGRRAFPFINSLDNFYAKQHNDGYICREINRYNGEDFFQRFDPSGTGPNILAWAEWGHFRATGDLERLERIFWALLAYHRWFQAHRRWQSGLYWATGLASGMDNQTRVPESLAHHRHYAWIDANLQAALNCYMLEQIGEAIGETAATLPLTEERLHLTHAINDQMWDAEKDFYCDTAPDESYSPVKSIGAYWALTIPGFVPADRLTAFLAHLRHSEAFSRPHRIPAQSADSPGYQADGGYWRGGVWSPTNYMTLAGLTQVNRFDLAHEIAGNHLTNVANVFQRTDTLWENYAPEEAAPGGRAKPNFVGWTGLSPIAILIEHILGVESDWGLRRVAWRRRLNTSEPYGVLHYPFGESDWFDLFGDNEKITVNATAPITLLVETLEGKMQVSLNAGASEIPLE